MNNKFFFTTELLKWNKYDNTRQMPWKGEKEPYKIWISEIILQQTRVEQGLAYYNKFIKEYPSVQQIAAAPQNKVFKTWEGLGYYTRCKNIIATAKYICDELNGKFPEKFDEILKLKGIGNYTASAIASFAYNLPHAVVDGNVFRVLSRFFGIETPVDTTAGKKLYSQLATELLDKKLPGIYNQSIMDFGAVICKPKPLCTICPLQPRCVAYAKDQVNSLPVKEKSIIRKSRWMYYLVIEHNKKFYVHKRTDSDIWQNLYEFVLIESTKPVSIAKLQSSTSFKEIFSSSGFHIGKVSKIYSQQLTHQSISGRFICIRLKEAIIKNDYRLVTKKQLEQLPFPKFITAYLKD